MPPCVTIWDGRRAPTPLPAQLRVVVLTVTDVIAELNAKIQVREMHRVPKVARLYIPLSAATANAPAHKRSLGGDPGGAVSSLVRLERVRVYML